MTQTKGGSGKSTLAQNIAVAAEKDGLKVLIVDLDPAQSAAKWWRRRGGPANPMLETDAIRGLAVFTDVLERKANKPDVMILDTPGELMSMIRAAVAAASVIVVPIAPSIKDWEAMDTVESIIIKAGKKPQTLFVINRFRAGTESSIDVKKALHERSGAVPLTVALATDHEKADAVGKTGAEISKKIAVEIGTLWDEIKRIGKANEQENSVSAA